MHEPSAILNEARLELARFPAVLGGLVGDLEVGTWRERPAPERWSPLEIVCHLRDEEADDFGARIRVILEGGKEFAPIDPEGWVQGRRYKDEDPLAALAAFLTRRSATLDLLAGAPADRLAGSRPLKSGVQLSGIDLLVAWVAHDRLHLRQMAGTLARLWAARWEPLRADYAGSLPYAPSDAGR